MELGPSDQNSAPPAQSWHRSLVAFIHHNSYYATLTSIFALFVGLLTILDHFKNVKSDVASVVTPEFSETQKDIHQTGTDILKRLDRLADVEKPQVTPSLPSVTAQTATVSQTHGSDKSPATSDIQPTAVDRPRPKFDANTLVAVWAPQGEINYRDKLAASILSDNLSTGLSVVSNKADAELSIEVWDVSTRKDVSGPCGEQDHSKWTGFTASATMTVRMVWRDRNTGTLSKPYSNSEPTCDPNDNDLTRNVAFLDLLTTVRKNILASAEAQSKSRKSQ
jgi:hypothetical protein